MPLPASFGTITVTGTYLTFLGAPASGTVTFQPPTNIFLKVTDVDVMVTPDPIVVTLDTAGAFSVVLPLTNDPDVVPSFTYAVTEQVTGLRRQYNVEVPVSLLPGPVDLSDLAPTGSVTVGTTALTKVVADTLYQPLGVGGATTVDELTDATAVGKAVVKAVDAAAARTAIGAGTSSLALGTTSTTAKAGDYQPTAANISDSTATGRSVLTAASAAAARTAIGAGTSSLAVGTTSTDAKAGNWLPAWTDLQGIAPAASATASGLVELATSAETTTGTDTVRAVTPAGVKAVADTKATYVAVGVTTSGRILVSNTSTPAGMQAGDVIIVVP